MYGLVLQSLTHIYKSYRKLDEATATHLQHRVHEVCALFGIAPTDEDLLALTDERAILSENEHPAREADPVERHQGAASAAVKAIHKITGFSLRHLWELKSKPNVLDLLRRPFGRVVSRKIRAAYAADLHAAVTAETEPAPILAWEDLEPMSVAAGLVLDRLAEWLFTRGIESTDIMNAVWADRRALLEGCSGGNLILSGVPRPITAVGSPRSYSIRTCDSRLTRRPSGATVPAMASIIRALVGAVIAAFRPRASLVLENFALRQQLAVLHRAHPRPALRPVERAFWVLLRRAWSRWADVLAIVQPATVIAWHRRGFARFWASKSRAVGRPPLAPQVVKLIEQMVRDNPLWSRRRIAAELALLGYRVSKDTVARYMPKPSGPARRPSSQTWKTFVRNHLAGTIAIDFLTVPTVTFGIVYVFFVLSLERRRVLHVNVTTQPHAAWAAQQIVEAVGSDASPARMIRDRDGIFGKMFDARVENLGIEQLRIAPRSPWQNGYAERFVGTLRRELLDHMIVLGERHLLRAVRAHVAYYNEDRPHMSLGGDAPLSRPVEPPAIGPVVALTRVGGLHHRYVRKAA